MVHKLVHNYLVRRGDTYYFRYRVPACIQDLCIGHSTEIKRSLRTDSYSTALAVVCKKLPLIKLIRSCRHTETIEQLYHELSDFSEKPTAIKSPNVSIKSKQTVLTLSEAWLGFVKWKKWTEKQGKANQRVFNNLIFFLGDLPVNEITKPQIRSALNSIARLPQRNKKNYKHIPLEQLTRMEIPSVDIVSGKYVKEHLKLCQSLFSRYLRYELDLLSLPPTDGLRYDYQDNRYASLNDEQVRTVFTKTQDKPSWFRWFLMLSAYSGARRSEIIRLSKSDFKYCADSKRHYFHIREGKTRAAIRAIPLHQKLIEDGLLNWIDSHADGALFKISPNRVTDLFNSLLEERINHIGERIVLHSIRHTFITKARAAGISSVLVQQVVGHEKSGAGQTDRYTHTFHLKDVLAVVDCIHYS